MKETEIVERLRRRFGIRGRGVVLGIGDDCAIFRPAGSRDDLVFTTDQLIESVHFRRTMPPKQVGQRALARALSDIAAMGASPTFCLTSLAAPRSFDIDAFYRGIASIADRYRLMLAGGDLAKSTTVSCDVVVCGSVPRGAALRRDGARVGDTIYVSGPLGGAATRGYRDVPQPRIAFGRKLRNRATACMDISDGLSLDLARLCEASQVGAALHSIPLADGATEDQALNGGEDYELLYTGHDLPGIPIGQITQTRGVTLRGIPLMPGGWDHFA